MSKNIQAVRGMRDITPAQIQHWQFIEACALQVFRSYGYREIRFPLVEKTELFTRSIGEVTDIVEKEMYTFDDRNGESLSLRPEGTAGCVRAGIEQGLLFNQQQRVWYAGPMFRYERPQKGRYRQFHQIGAETFGFSGVDIEAELIFLTARLWKLLGITDVKLELNTLGTQQERQSYRGVLVDYLQGHHDQLDEDSQRRIKQNPLRILDSKNPDMQTLIEQAPKFTEHLGEQSRERFDQLQQLLQIQQVPFVVNTRLVRGLDYYCHTVFEWVTDRLGAQGTICGGGRYDTLVEQMGGKPTHAAGFGIGIERLVSLLEEDDLAVPDFPPQLFMVLAGDAAEKQGMELAENLRDQIQGLRIQVNCGGGSFKTQLKRADRSQAIMALVMGAQEVESGTIGIKPLRSGGNQLSIPQDELANYLQQQDLEL